MKVRELIEWLETMNPEDEVHRSQDSHNYWGDVVAPSVSQVFVGEVAWSEYHRMDQLLGEDSSEGQDTRRVVIIE
jgi:hypothetical protein